VDTDLAVHVPVDDLGDIRPPARPAEGGAAPDPAGHQLERAGRDLLAGAGDADDDAFAPALVAAFQRLAHHLHIADAFKGIVDAAVGHLDDRLHHVRHLARIDEVGHAELAGERHFLGIDVDADDAVTADEL